MSTLKQISNLLQGEFVIIPMSDLHCTLGTLRTAVSRLARTNHAHYSVKTVGNNIYVVCNRRMGFEWEWDGLQIWQLGKTSAVLLTLEHHKGGWWFNMPHKHAPGAGEHITDGKLSDAAKFCEEAVSKYLIERERTK